MIEREIFTAALTMDDRAERAAFLDEACAGDAALRQRVESLLAENLQLGSFMDVQSQLAAERAEIPVDPIAVECPGTDIGPYKLVQQIGEGGMGVVYLAEQAAPVRRMVALKIIKPGMDSREVIARFEAERQALALMGHPNIARVFDGGATASGRPYFVMELVRGVTITDYCDENNLPLHERLALFVAVCHAVQHAHQKGIIHRDIKPSNVLVTLHDGRPVPKVIDFGVAKAIGQQLTDKTLFTHFAQMVGTPLYMSPEQAELTGLDIDTRGDIYSLGVLLYELLTGTTPIDGARMKKAAFDEIRRMIREEDPPSPSTRLSSSTGEKQTAVAARRKVDPRRLSRLVRGDLDWIVMKALEKDRTRRYETANGFADDIGRYLSDEPVLACPPSSAYRFRKFARRNRVAFLTGALVLSALVLGTFISTWQAIRATRAEQVAEAARLGESQQRKTTEEERNAANAARSAEAQQRQIAEENARKARQAVDDYFTLVSESQLLDVPGLQPLRKKLLESAFTYYESFRNQNGGDSIVRAELAATQLRLAQVYLQNNRIDDSIEAMDQSLDLVEELLREQPRPNGFPQNLAGFRKNGRILNYFTLWPSDLEKSVRVAQRSISVWEQFVDENPDTPGFQSDLGSFYCELSDMQFGRQEFAASLDASQTAQTIFEKLTAQFPEQPEHRASLADALEYVSRALRYVNRAVDAEAYSRRAMALRTTLVAEFPNTPEYRASLAYSYVRLGVLLEDLRRRDEALGAYQEGYERWQKIVADFPNVSGFRKRLANATASLAGIQSQFGHRREAEDRRREAADILMRLVKEGPDEFGETLEEYRDAALQLAQVLIVNEKPQEVEELMRQAHLAQLRLITEFKDRVVADESFYAYFQLRSHVLHSIGREGEAIEALREEVDLLISLLNEEPGERSKNFSEENVRHRLVHCLTELAAQLTTMGQLIEAETAVRGTIAHCDWLSDSFPKKKHYRVHQINAHHQLAIMHQTAKRPLDALAEFLASLEAAESFAADFPDLAEAWELVGRRSRLMANQLTRMNRQSEAEAALKRAAQAFERRRTLSGASVNWTLNGDKSIAG